MPPTTPSQTASPPVSTRASDRPAGRRRKPAATRVPVEQLLAPDVRAALTDVARSGGEITAATAKELDARFDINKRYGVTPRRLRNYLSRLASRCQPRADDGDANGATPAQDTWPEKLRAHRRRQASVATILDTAFGRLADCNPDLWERRAYLLLVGMVYERLALDEEEIPTDELVKLAKVLAENRRIEAQARQAADRDGGGPADPHDEEKTPDGQLPESVADAVRQVYGTNFNPPRTGAHAPDTAGVALMDEPSPSQNHRP